MHSGERRFSLPSDVDWEAQGKPNVGSVNRLTHLTEKRVHTHHWRSMERHGPFSPLRPLLSGLFLDRQPITLTAALGLIAAAFGVLFGIVLASVPLALL